MSVRAGRHPLADAVIARSVSAMQRLRLVTYNIAHGRGLTPISGLTTTRKLRANLLKIAHLLKRLDADVVALQEIDERSRWAGNFDHLEYLKQHTGYAHSVFGINNRRPGLLNLCYGNAFLSKHPIVESETIVFGKARVGEKGFLYMEVEVGGVRVPLVNLHLHYRSRDHRFIQTDRLLAWLRDKQRNVHARWSTPPIVCGDMNNPGHLSDATASLLSHLWDYGDYSLHPTNGYTFPSPLPRRLLDFVFLPPACRNARSKVIKCIYSDHRPVVVDFGLTDPKK